MGILLLEVGVIGIMSNRYADGEARRASANLHTKGLRVSVTKY